MNVNESDFTEIYRLNHCESLTEEFFRNHISIMICYLLLQVPTLIVYGENDKTPMAKQAADNLRIMPNSQEVPLKNAGHAAYLDVPDVFHKLLYNFMELLRQ